VTVREYTCTLRTQRWSQENDVARASRIFSRIPDAGWFPQADHSNVGQTVPEASQAIWFGSRLVDERKSFAAIRSLRVILIYRVNWSSLVLQDKIKEIDITHLQQYIYFFTRRDKDIFRYISWIGQDSATIQSISSSCTIRSERGMDHDKGQVLRRGIQFERSAIFDIEG